MFHDNKQIAQLKEPPTRTHHRGVRRKRTEQRRSFNARKRMQRDLEREEGVTESRGSNG
ncbi:MAG: hypothetical protein KIT31_24390 [Deltaproteobacteria bacterium]|nr:hypothetical protein [Deltaproteobacteria bacterium]